MHVSGYACVCVALMCVYACQAFRIYVMFFTYILWFVCCRFSFAFHYIFVYPAVVKYGRRVYERGQSKLGSYKNSIDCVAFDRDNLTYIGLEKSIFAVEQVSIAALCIDEYVINA